MKAIVRTSFLSPLRVVGEAAPTPCVRSRRGVGAGEIPATRSFNQLRARQGHAPALRRETRLGSDCRAKRLLAQMKTGDHFSRRQTREPEKHEITVRWNSSLSAHGARSRQVGCICNLPQASCHKKKQRDML